MKTVCVIVQNHYESDIRVIRKVQALLAAGYGVDVLALASSGAKSRQYVLDGANVYTISLGKKRGSLARYAFEYVAFFLWSFYKVSTLMAKRHYSIIDINNLPDFLVFASVYARLRRAKVVFDMHEITPEFYISKYGIGEKSLTVGLLKLVEKASFSLADRVITINKPIEDLLVRRGMRREKSTIVMNSADDSMFAAAESSAPKDRSAASPQFLMMYHGTLTRIYGLDIALSAFSQAQDQMPGAEFWILGNGPERKSLEDLSRQLGLENKVKFLGTVRPQEIPAWLHQCDAGILPTRQDVFLDFSFSNKLSEYVIMGKPCAISRLKAICHYFSEDALAYFEPGNVTDLARQMVSLYRNPDLRTNLARTAKLQYAPIAWEVMKDRYLQMMDSLAGKQPKFKDPTPDAVAHST